MRAHLAVAFFFRHHIFDATNRIQRRRTMPLAHEAHAARKVVWTNVIAAFLPIRVRRNSSLHVSNVNTCVLCIQRRTIVEALMAWLLAVTWS